ncbi:uncharacterized protein LOC121725438 isoform X2 [Aricia agestis]|uniref:uncharacterized protein LOC121725438 isoform X2 n=1 Tax=Aricia agestis TaxID=91739 RepID=UPI001C207428|nr:uncharacterized protein LOC121725438 isoform X2 [Aricia agestis]
MSNDPYEVTIRFARQEDLRHRMELVRQGFSAHFWDAFWFFLLQELTLECCVLGAAVLFIFCGVSAAGCLLLLPVAAAVVSMCILVAHEAMAQKHAKSVSNELFGVVAEVRGAPVSGPDRRRALHIRSHLAPPAPAPLAERDRPEYAQVVGTVSVSESWGPREDGWLHAFAVHPDGRSRPTDIASSSELVLVNSTDRSPCELAPGTE